MANKFEIDLGRYDKLFLNRTLNNNGTNAYLQKFVDDTAVKKANPYFWEEHFVKDSVMTPFPLEKGFATYTVQNIKNGIPVMPDAHTSGSEVSQSDTSGYSTRLGTIMEYAMGLYETTQSREQLAAMMKESGNDTSIMKLYQNNLHRIELGFNMLLSNLSAQKLSTGGYSVPKGQGVDVKMDSIVPVENFLKAGAKIWADPTCDIPEQMRLIQEKFKQEGNGGTGYDGAMEWNIDDTTVREVLLKNEKFIKLVTGYKAATGTGNIIILNGENSKASSIVSEADLVGYSNWAESLISPIKVMREYQAEQTLTGTVKKRGWKVGNAVLRPTGYAGVIKYTEVRDIRLLKSEASPSIIVSTAVLGGGLFHLANIMRGDGLFRQYHSNMYGAFSPELTEYEQHLIVDTKTAD